MPCHKVPDLERVVCAAGCNHPACAAIRDLFTGAVCSVCGQAMRPGETFYLNDRSELMHAVCVLERELDGARR